MKDVLGNVSKAANVNDTDLTNIIEDCQTFATVRVSAQKSTEEAIAEIRKIFYNFKVVKIIQDVGKREEISLDLSSNFSDAAEKKRNNQSLDLSEIPHLTLATENFTMSIPRPTISPVHQGKTDDNMFSEYYQRGNCTKYSQGQVFENPEFKVKRSYLNPEDLRFDERMPKKKQVYSSSTEKDFLGNENATFCVKVVNY
ncbi:uncharacterized protein CEXT_776391 [Caerostris extrusa]|uniref:Uncharacterized protein n=1 Tax=Caerostris extrusa TaxID=172846 RepID=A0AAV4UWH0_CAEEX|nr:uncharacterized protein CEXT_776391 [Caerostris extrusa]